MDNETDDNTQRANNPNDLHDVLRCPFVDDPNNEVIVFHLL